MRRRFFIEKFENDSAELHGETAEHLGRVLRAQPGQLYELSDGRCVWLARIEHVALSKRDDSRIKFTLVEPVASHEAAVQISLLIALVKFDRFEWCLEKATELGAREIIPLGAARSDAALLAAAAKRRPRWEKILRESAQQARRLRPPAIGEVMVPQEAFVRREPDARCKILLSERRDAMPMREALASANGISSAALAIGPEGGWTDDEIRVARTQGFAAASLGENILRTETAVLVSLAILRFAAGA